MFMMIRRARRLATFALAMGLVLSAVPTYAEPPPEAAAVVRLRDSTVFHLTATRAGKTPTQRAQQASQALQQALDANTWTEPRLERQGESVVIFANAIPVVQLGADDAQAAGDASLDEHAATVLAAVRSALDTERTRRDVADTVFAWSLLVLSAVVTFFLLKRIRTGVVEAQTWVAANPDRLPALRVGSVDVVRPAAMRGALTVFLHIGSRILQLCLLYIWVLVGLSLFAATRAYSTRLSDTIVRPVSTLLLRVGSALPMLLIHAVALLALVIVLRFTALVFGSIARGETVVSWLPADLAHATGVLVRLGTVVLALLVGIPLLTGNDHAGLTRLGLALLAACALASTPVLANVAAGVLLLFARRLHPGDWVEMAGVIGRVRVINLIETRLEDGRGYTVRLPHLMALQRRTRIFGASQPASFRLRLGNHVLPTQVFAIAQRAAAAENAVVRVEVVAVDDAYASYSIVCEAAAGVEPAALCLRVAEACMRAPQSESNS